VANFKKIMAVMVCLIMLFVSVSITSLAAGTPTISIGSASANDSGVCSVNVSIANNPGIIAAKMVLLYDKDVLTLKSVGDTGLLKDKTSVPEPDILYWEDALATENNTANGIIATLTFEVKDGAPSGKYPVTVGYENGDIYNIDLTDVNFTVSCGYITVISDVCYHTNTEWRITKEPTAQTSGERSEFCVDCGIVLNKETVPPTQNETGTCGELVWSYNTNGYELTISGNGEIPDFTTSYLSQPWYSKKPNIKKIILTSNSKNVGKYAFAKHTALESVVLPNSIEFISENAFEGCVKLTNVNFPSSLKEINNNAFMGCTSLTDISSLPQNLVSIGENAFKNCIGLSGVLRIKNALYIGDNAFYGCNNLNAIVLPDNIGYVGANILPFDKIYCRLGSNAAALGYNVIGDLDGNGQLAAGDVVSMKKQLLTDVSYNVGADVNEDNSLNILDIINLLKEISE